MAADCILAQANRERRGNQQRFLVRFAPASIAVSSDALLEEIIDLGAGRNHSGNDNVMHSKSRAIYCLTSIPDRTILVLDTESILYWQERRVSGAAQKIRQHSSLTKTRSAFEAPDAKSRVHYVAFPNCGSSPHAMAMIRAREAEDERRQTEWWCQC
jgi:hypothetical protein